MTNPNTPRVLTTHNYVMSALNEFYHDEVNYASHHAAWDSDGTSSLVTTPHTFEASLRTPLRENLQTGSVRVAGPQQLVMSLWTHDQEPQVDGRGFRRRQGTEPGTEQRCLTEASVLFNTRRLVSIDGHTFTDGIDASIDPQTVKDGTKDNFFLTYLKEFTDARVLTFSRVGREVKGASIELGNSRDITKGKFDISDVATAIAKHTGRSLPPSLEVSPQVSYIVSQLIPALPFDRSMQRAVVTIDSFDWRARPLMRRKTKLVDTKYIGYCPVPTDQHLLFMGLLTDWDRQLLNHSLGIDVNQTTFLPGGIETVYAHDATQARELLAPFYNAVTSLRRFRNQALRPAGINR